MPGQDLFQWIGVTLIALVIIVLAAGWLWDKHRNPQDPPAS